VLTKIARQMQITLTRGSHRRAYSRRVDARCATAIGTIIFDQTSRNDACEPMLGGVRCPSLDPAVLTALPFCRSKTPNTF
jgi:hypothetical protein